MKENTFMEEYLTVGDVCAFLNVSQSQAYALAHRKDFPVCRFGGSIRIPRAPFLVWVERHSHIPDYLSA